MVRWVLALVLATATVAHPATIQPIGALGNSGEAGNTLVRIGVMPFDRSASGVAIDSDWTLWVSGGDAINRIGLNGKLIERFPLEPKGSIVNSKTFTVLNGTLYFFGHMPNGEPALFALPMRPKGVAKPVPVALPPRKREWVPYLLAPQPLHGQLVLVCEPKELSENQIGVYLLSPFTPPQVRLAFAIHGQYPSGVAVDEGRSVIYIGGDLGLFVSGETHQNVYAIVALNPDGKLVSNKFPVACVKTPAIPTQFRGVLSLAGGALWDAAWYGFLARLDLDGHGKPGRVVEWHHELGYPTQVLAVPQSNQLFCVTTSMPDAFYLFRWDEGAQRVRFIRRIGCLPIISSLGLSDDGWVTVGTGRAQLWWRWEAAADEPPHKAELHIAVTPGFFHDGKFFALAAQYRLDDLQKRSPVPTVFHWRVGDRNEASRVGEPVPLKRPVGLSVQVTLGKPDAVLFVTDAETKQIWRTRFWLPDLRPDNAQWQIVQVKGHAFQAPTDIFALTDGRLLVADNGHILLLEPDGDAYRVVWSFRRWGNRPDQQFGNSVRFTVDGAWMLVSDTERHRVVWLDWTEWKVLGQFGETDKAGDDTLHLNTPTFVALRGNRTLVADSGNQRLLKLVLSP